MNTTGSLTNEVVSPDVVKLDQIFFPTPWTNQQWDNLDLSTHTLFGWREREVLKGFSLLWTMEGDDVAHLLKILLLEDTRGTGASQLFWSAMIHQLQIKGFRSVYLEVEATNFRAKSFYEKVGFKLLRRNKSYYSSGEDALIMSLTL